MIENKILNKPLVLDGAIGTALQPVFQNNYTELWSSLVNISDPEKVIALHREYIDAGTDIITTNTFRTNPAAVIRSGSNSKSYSLVRKSVKLAREAACKNILIAGSNPPAEDCYQVSRLLSLKELKQNHHSHIASLKKCNVDFILNETQSHFDEIKIICDECFGYPFVVSLFLTEDLRILSGHKVEQVIEYLTAYLPDGNLEAIGFNCIDVSTFKKLLKKIRLDFPWGFYLNCGAGRYTDKIITCGITPSQYIKVIKPALEFNPVFLGSCCGSSREHTRAIRNLVDEVY